MIPSVITEVLAFTQNDTSVVILTSSDYVELTRVAVFSGPDASVARADQNSPIKQFVCQTLFRVLMSGNATDFIALAYALAMYAAIPDTLNCARNERVRTEVDGPIRRDPMAKLTKTSVFKEQPTRPETTMDKTTRVVRKMVDDEAEERLAKLTRLRNARLEREANTPPKEVAVKRTARAKAAPKG
ncbi:hypothetical protein [Yoonia sp. R78084]|uniref:hypothetical protein n=1 Tax=Yoonia sp. R78084 TaxID=3093869 RepID=UPI0037DC25AE